MGITGTGGEGGASWEDRVTSGEIERGEFGGGVGLSRGSALNNGGRDRSSGGSRAGNSPWGTRGADGTYRSTSISNSLPFFLSDKAELLAEAAGRRDRSLNFVVSSTGPPRLGIDRFSFS